MKKILLMLIVLVMGIGCASAATVTHNTQMKTVMKSHLDIVHPHVGQVVFYFDQWYYTKVNGKWIKHEQLCYDIIYKYNHDTIFCHSVMLSRTGNVWTLDQMQKSEYNRLR